VHSAEGRASEGVPEGTSPSINNSLLISSFLSHFVEKKYFHRNMGTYKIGELPWHLNALGFFCWG
jgi:hypothetical protein